jgi:enamine deaminase RidA (YjgF/YER057c/UK114 family)
VDEVEADAPGAKAPSRERIERRTSHRDTTLTSNVKSMTVAHHNPAGLPSNPAFSQAVSIDGPARTIYVGGQNAVAADGSIVGDDVAAQTARALENLETVLADAGAGLDDVVSWTITAVEGQDLRAGFGAFTQAWGTRGNPPAISVAVVSGLANPGFLVEISAIAVVEASA